MRISDWSSDVCSSDLTENDMFKKMFVAALMASAVMLSAAGNAQTTPGKPAPEKIGLHTLASLPLMSELVLSPDGTKIAMTLGVGNEFGYAILDLAKPGSKPKIFARSEEHTSELQSLMRISYAVFCLKKKKTKLNT